jgi:hypothetical protein
MYSNFLFFNVEATSGHAPFTGERVEEAADHRGTPAVVTASKVATIFY